jgi:hypothetical protein
MISSMVSEGEPCALSPSTGSKAERRVGASKVLGVKHSGCTVWCSSSISLGSREETDDSSDLEAIVGEGVDCIPDVEVANSIIAIADRPLHCATV